MDLQSPPVTAETQRLILRVDDELLNFAGGVLVSIWMRFGPMPRIVSKTSYIYTHFGGIEQYKSMEILRDFPYNNALFGLVSYHSWPLFKTSHENQIAGRGWRGFFGGHGAEGSFWACWGYTCNWGWIYPTEQRKKPWLVGLYRVLYYPVI